MTDDKRVSDDKLREIIDGCDGVTPGPWDQVGRTGGTIRHGHPKKGGWIASMHWRNAKINGAHIARLDPQTVAAICSELIASRSRQKPDGWRLVPVEPTEAMIEAGNAAYWSVNKFVHDATMADTYRAMLAAAPINGGEVNGRSSSAARAARI